MASIQDIHALEERITDITEEFVSSKDNYTNPQLRVFRTEEGIGLEIIDTPDTIDSANVKTYPLELLLKVLVVPDNDAISYIANEWVFLYD